MNPTSPLVALKSIGDFLISGIQGSMTFANYVRNYSIDPSSSNLLHSSNNIQGQLYGTPQSAFRCAKSIGKRFEPVISISFRRFGSLIKATIFIFTYQLRFVMSYTPIVVKNPAPTKEYKTQLLRSQSIQKVREAEEMLRQVKVEIRKSREKLLEKECEVHQLKKDFIDIYTSVHHRRDDLNKSTSLKSPRLEFSPKVLSLISPHLLCVVCGEIFVNPVTLACGHSICSKCHMENSDVIVCLQCKKSFQRDESPPSKNYALMHIANAFHDASRDS